jgi:hypothetical protein
MSPWCKQVHPSGPGPYPVTLEFFNPGGGSTWLLDDCTLSFDVASCTDGFSGVLHIAQGCTVDCDVMADGGQCIQCEPCFRRAVELADGERKQVTWEGFTYTFETAQGVGCTCHRPHLAPADKYRITVPVWDEAFDAETQSVPTPSRHVSVDFILSADHVVVVPLHAMP